MANGNLSWIVATVLFFYRNLVRNPVVCIRFLVWKFLLIIKELGIVLLNFLISDRIKRFVLLTSLYRVVEEDRMEWDKASMRLNQKLKLVERIDSLLFPYRYAEKFWDRNKVTQCLMVCDTNQSRATAERLARMAPRWLLYGSSEKILQEIETVVQLGRSQLKAA